MQVAQKQKLDIVTWSCSSVEYNGQDEGKPIYLALTGLVFDVTHGKSFYGKDGGYSFFAGRDGTSAFMTGTLRL